VKESADIMIGLDQAPNRSIQDKKDLKFDFQKVAV
jgi:hypothetical protein